MVIICMYIRLWPQSVFTVLLPWIPLWLESEPFSVNEIRSLQEAFVSIAVWKSFAQNS